MTIRIALNHQTIYRYDRHFAWTANDSLATSRAFQNSDRELFIKHYTNRPFSKLAARSIWQLLGAVRYREAADQFEDRS